VNSPAPHSIQAKLRPAAPLAPWAFGACGRRGTAGSGRPIWRRAVTDEASIWEAVQAMLFASPIEEDAEEWAIHDYEGFEGAEVGEYYSTIRRWPMTMSSQATF